MNNFFSKTSVLGFCFRTVTVPPRADMTTLRTCLDVIVSICYPLKSLSNDSVDVFDVDEETDNCLIF